MHKLPPKKIRLLHFDADPLFAQDFLLSLLDHPNPPHAIVHASTLKEACELCAEEQFDVIFSDIQIDGKLDRTVIPTLRKVAAQVPLVVMTECDDWAEAVSAINAGAVDVLSKQDLDFRQIMRKVHFAMAWQRRQAIRHGQDELVPHQQRPGSDWGQGTATCPLRVLHIDEDIPFARLLRTLVTQQTDTKFNWQHERSFGDGIAALQTQTFDAILLSNGPTTERGFERISKTHAAADQTPLIVVVDEASEMSAMAAVRGGAHDYLEKEQLAQQQLLRTIRLAMAREGAPLGHSSSPSQLLDNATVASADLAQSENTEIEIPPVHQQSVVLGSNNTDQRRVIDAPAVPTAPVMRPANDRRTQRREENRERRGCTRYLVTKPIIAIPILPDNDPDWSNRVEGYTLDMSLSGLCFEVNKINVALSKSMLVGVENEKGEMFFTEVRVKQTQASGVGTRVRAEICEPEQNLLRDENLVPHLDAKTHQLTTGLGKETLNHWANIGVMKAELVDRVMLCPDCGGLPTFRNGCPACGSARIDNAKMIHHFACAHVSHITDFEYDGELVCPKCRTRKLVMGTDFEYLNGPYICHDCNGSDVELKNVGHCLSCGLRFPAEEAVERELVAYHANRLVPLDFIGT